MIFRLRPEHDAGRLQELLERCSDHYMLHEGWPTPPDAGVHELTGVPAGRDPRDLHLFGMADVTGDLIAAAQLLRDYPSEGAWWIGLLVVEPRHRSRGVGAELLQWVVETARGEGARSLQLVVSLRNERAARFWERAGFRDTGDRARVAARSGHVDHVRILAREIGDLP